MWDNYNYPMGADNPDAPWNQSEPEAKEFDVLVTMTISKVVTLSTKDYTAEVCEDVETDDDTGRSYCVKHIEMSTDDVDWKEEYDTQSYSPLLLLKDLEWYYRHEIEELEKQYESAIYAKDKRELRKRINILKVKADLCEWDFEDVDFEEY